MNHNGDLQLAKKMVIEAKKCGADCVKFQTYKSDQVVSDKAPKAKYQLKNTSKSETQLKMLSRLELTRKDFIKLNNFCLKKNIIFLSTPYNKEDVDFLTSIGVKAFKLASMHLTEIDFVNYVVSKNKPVFISTGMSNLNDIRKTIKKISKNKNKKIILLQCTTNYPSKIKDSNLNVLDTFKKNFNYIVGYSDHTMQDLSCLISIAKGAKVIEKHFTLNKKMKGPDHSSSFEPHEFKDMVNKIRNVEIILGSEKKFISNDEKKNMMRMKRSIYLSKSLKKNSLIYKDSLTYKRPNNGIPASKIYDIIGKKISKNLKSGHLLKWSDIK